MFPLEEGDLDELETWTEKDWEDFDDECDFDWWPKEEDKEKKE